MGRGKSSLRWVRIVFSAEIKWIFIGKYPFPNSSCAWEWGRGRGYCFPSNKSSQSRHSAGVRLLFKGSPLLWIPSSFWYSNRKVYCVHFTWKEALSRWYLSLSECVRGGFLFLDSFLPWHLKRRNLHWSTLMWIWNSESIWSSILPKDSPAEGRLLGQRVQQHGLWTRPPGSKFWPCPHQLCEFRQVI